MIILSIHATSDAHVERSISGELHLHPTGDPTVYVALPLKVAKAVCYELANERRAVESGQSEADFDPGAEARSFWAAYVASEGAVTPSPEAAFLAGFAAGRD